MRGIKCITMNSDLIEELSEGSNRIVVTQNSTFNPKRKKENIVLSDVRSIRTVNDFISNFKIDIHSQTYPGWMTAPDVYINFLIDKESIFNFGVVLNNLVRSSHWKGDYAIENASWFHSWLLENKVKYFERNT